MLTGFRQMSPEIIKFAGEAGKRSPALGARQHQQDTVHRIAKGIRGLLRIARADIVATYASPGVKRATDEFFADKPEQVSVLYANEYSNGYFRKL